MQKKCPTCGGKLDEYIFIFKQWDAGKIKEKLEKLLNVQHGVDVEITEQKRIKLRFHEPLSKAQIKKMKTALDKRHWQEIDKYGTVE